MKIKKHFLIFTALLAVSFSFISCFNNFIENTFGGLQEEADNSETNGTGDAGSNQIKYATLQGTISFDGAVPSELLAAAGKIDDDSGRSAMPQMNTSWVYVLQATADGQTNPDPVVVRANSTSPGYSYTGLPTSQAGIDWTITVRLKQSQSDSDDAAIMTDECTLTLNNDNSIYIHEFLVKPVTGEGKVGSLLLDMTVASSVTTITTECADTGWVAPTTQFSTITGDTANKIASIQKSGIPSGTYSVRFNFKDSNGLLLYSNRQSINIFNNCTTSIWVNSGTSGNSDPIDSSGNYTVTQAMITNFQNNTFYVGPTSFNDTPGTVANGFNGTPVKPLSNVSDVSTIIGARADSTTAEYTILVNGSITGTQSITAACNGKAKSIRLCGISTAKETDNVTPIHKLNGNSAGTTLTIGTAVLVTIDNLLITGGSNPDGNGGGIAITGGNVELTSGAVVNGNTAQVGGGVYLNTGNLYLNGTAVVGKPISALGANPTRAGTTSGTYANKATQSGGGIEVYEGTLWLGYRPPAQNETQPQALTTSGGVIYNLVAGTTETHGGGIDNNHGTLNIAHGFVSYNYAFCESGITKDGCGGGVTTADAMYLLGDATISHNESAYGGAVYISKGRDGRHGYFTMSGGSIESNASYKQNGIDGDGGGIAIGASGSFEMSGGTIKLNTAESRGGAIFHNGSLCKISGGTNCTATIPEGDGTNNIFLIKNGQTITLEGSTGHTGTGEIAVTAQLASRGVTVLTGNGIADYYSKFKLTGVYGMGIKNTGKIDLDVIVTDIYVNKNATGSNCFIPGDYTYKDSTWNNSTYSLNSSATSSQNKPFKLIENALQFITYQASAQDYTIHIVGTYTIGSNTQEILIKNNSDTNNLINLVKTATDANPTVTAKSITITGVADNTNPPKISGGNNYTCMSIATEVPVTISSISIENGSSTGAKAAGIEIDSSDARKVSDVTLSSGTIIHGNSGYQVGAIHNYGTLKIAGAQIYDNEATLTNSGYGGAIKNEGGTIYIYGNDTVIGKTGDAVTAAATSSNGQHSNTAGKAGGAIYNTTLSGLGGNFVGYIYIGKDADGNISSPTIEYNYSYANGGGIYNCYNCIIEFHGGVIAHNTAVTNGGGIYNEGSFILKASSTYKTIKVNNAASGGAIYETGGYASLTFIPYNSNYAYISIPCNDSDECTDSNSGKNTIYLAANGGTSPCQITITGLLRYNFDQMRIDTDFATFKGKTIIKTSNDYTPSIGPSSDFQSIILPKFKIKQPSGVTYPYFYSSEKLTTDPQICQAKIAEPVVRTYANIAPGDILMKNGDVIAYEESLDLGSKKNDAIGIVFYNGTEVSSNGTSRIVALGIKYTEIGLKRPTNMENESWHPTEAPYSGLVVTCSGTAVTGNNANAKNGKNNYTTARQSATGASKVQSAGAFYECYNYKNYDSNLAGTSYENDWYLPSVTELLKIKENNSYVNNSLSILGKSEIKYYSGGNGQAVVYQPYLSSNTAEYTSSNPVDFWAVYLNNEHNGHVERQSGDNLITRRAYHQAAFVIPIHEIPNN